MKIIKIVLLKIIFIILFISFKGYAVAISPFFVDNFDGNAIDLNKWNVYQNNGNINVNSGKVILSSSGNSFPYISSKNIIFPDNTFKVIIEFKYNNITCWGDGLNITDYIPLNGSVPSSGHAILNYWQDCNTKLTLSSSVCPNNNPNCGTGGPVYSFQNFDTNKHILELEYNSQTKIIKAVIDNNLVFTSVPSHIVPKYIWFGHPKFQDHSDLWTGFEIEQILVNEISSSSPLILLPGMTACWSPVLFNGGESDNWRLWTAPIDSTYKPLMQNLEAAGLVKNQDYFLFCYDWRKPIDYNKDKLNAYIDNTLPAGSPVNLVGHSMGGLITRAYTQAYPEKVNKAISVGSPQRGAAEAYFGWEGGILINDRKLKGYLADLYVRHLDPHAKFYVNAIRANIPSVKDLLPTEDFLAFGAEPYQYKPIADHLQKNDYFMSLNSNVGDALKQRLNLIYGNKGANTLGSIKITTPGIPHANWIHYTNGIWEDGEPLWQHDQNNEIDYSPSYINTAGDNTVTVHSALLDSSFQNYEIVGDHSEIINQQEGINKIFEMLDIDYPVQPIGTTAIDKLFALIMHSPADMTITDANGQSAGFGVSENTIPGSFYDEEAKTIILVNPTDNLSMKVTGQNWIAASSPYAVSFFQSTSSAPSRYYRMEGQISASEETQHSIDLNQPNFLILNDNYAYILRSVKDKYSAILSYVQADPYHTACPADEIEQNLNNILPIIDQFDQSYQDHKYQQAVNRLYHVFRLSFNTRAHNNHCQKTSGNNELTTALNHRILDAFSELNQLFVESNRRFGLHLPHIYYVTQQKVSEKLLKHQYNLQQARFDKGKKVYPYQTEAYQNADSNLIAAAQAIRQKQYPEAINYLMLSLRFIGEI